MLTRDGRLLFATRAVRLLGYGFLSVVLVLYLAAAGLDGNTIGVILMLALLGDAVISLWLTTHADRLGRRRVLSLGAWLIVLTGVVLAVTKDPLILGAVAIVGVISPSGNEVGPFLAIEQAALSQTVSDAQRTRAFGWYAVAGSLATAFGALAAGAAAAGLRASGMTDLDAYHVMLVAYAGMGVLLAVIFRLMSPAVEAPGPVDASVAMRLGLHRSRGVVARLSLLFGLDAFGGGFVTQAFIAFWLYLRFGVDAAPLGGLLFAFNLMAAGSALVATRLAKRFGLINTMVFTHLPSNVLLILVPFAPSLEVAALLLVARFAISQMDVPTRQSYTMAVVDPDERSAAAGVTGVARSVGAAISPALAAPLYASGMTTLPFVIAGSLKIVYDLLLYAGFRRASPPEERTTGVRARPTSG